MKIFLLLPILVTGIFNVKEPNKIDNKQIIDDKIVFVDDDISNSTDAEATIGDVNSVTVKLNYNYQRPSKDYFGENISEDEYHRKLIQYGKRYHQNKNEEILESLNVSGLRNLYVSKYAPYFTFSASSSILRSNNSNMLIDLAKSNDVEQIVVSKSEEQLTPNLTNVRNMISYQPSYENENINGEGVVVGILEPTILNKNHSNFINTDITVRNFLFPVETVSDHTTIMGSIIAGTDGLAPAAKLLSIQLMGNANDEIDWLLDHNVNVINCSYGDTNPDGIYTSKSGYMDYIINAYLITIVASSGNSGTYVSNPGLGYNVITVGACGSESYLPRSFSSYIVVEGPHKPNLIAPGQFVNVSPFGSQSGTSISTAITTGTIALLMQKMPSLKNDPTLVRALICANTTIPSDDYHGLSDMCGTGVLNYYRTLVNIGNARSYYNRYEGDCTVADFNVQLEEGSTIRICMSWLRCCTIDNLNYISDYDLLLKYPNGNVAVSAEIHDNIEFIEFVVPSDGAYGIEIDLQGDLRQNDLIGLAYCIL